MALRGYVRLIQVRVVFVLHEPAVNKKGSWGKHFLKAEPLPEAGRKALMQYVPIHRRFYALVSRQGEGLLSGGKKETQDAINPV